MDPLKAKANFSKVCQLLVDKGGEALRFTFDAIHPPSTLAAVLNAKEPVLRKIKAINTSQWDLLFPTSGAAPDSNNFDITLLTNLLRNICGLPAPATGWNVMPLAGDVSASADVARIKLFRNEVYGHITRAQLDDATFNTLWQEISQPLTRLGILQNDIDEIKMAPLSPEEESYIKKLKEGKERDENILSELKDVKKEMSELREKFESVIPPQLKPQEWEPTSCFPNKLPMFTGREAEIKKVIDLVKDDKKALVLLHGGPGFGKTAIAIEVSHKLDEDPTILVVFSQLTTATNEDEIIRQLCFDVGVNHQDDPKQSLIFRFKKIKRNVILVMDNIENLLEEKCRSAFDDFIRLLLKHTNCQIITTSRSSYLIPELSMGSVDVGEMEDEACIKLLRKHCRKEEDEEECCHQDEKFLRTLAELCGHVPLAMCIAGSLVDDFSVEDSDELVQDLKNQPMETLECPESNRYVKRAIDVSYQKCSKEEQETFVRLSVFEGSFSEDAAKAVIKKRKSDTRRLLRKLFRRSLIKQPTQHRYSIHLLIKHFLKDKQEGGNEIAKKAHAEGMRAEVLMVEYYLELGHQLTIKSYSKDGYKVNSDALKREASNIQNVLKICCQQEDPTRSDISDCLASSEIYKTSSRLFSIFIRSIIPRPIVHEFLERCANLAKERGQHIIKIDFDCLLAAEIRDKSMGKSDEHFVSKMENIKKEFETHYEDVKEDKSLCAHFHYQNGRYLSFISKSCEGKERLKHAIQAREELEKSLELRETLTHTPVGKADTIFLLMHLGTECKVIFTNERYLKNTSEADAAFEQAEKYYRDAIELSKVNLGEEHLLTLWIYKNLADLFLTDKKHDQAEEMYTLAINISQNLGLDATEKYVLLLKNLGVCLTESDRASEAIQILKRAREIAEKLAESNEPNECTLKVYTSLANCLQQSDRADEAVEVLENARDNAERLDENHKTTVYKTEIYILLAECLKKGQRANKAIEVLERARDIAEKLPESNEPNECTFKVYISLADCLKQNDRADEAIEVLEKARDNAEKFAVNDEPTVYKMKIYIQLAECLRQSDRANEAVEVLEKARDNAEKLAENDEPTVHKTKIYLLLAECLKQNQRVNEAYEILEKARDNAEKLAENDEPTVHKTKIYLLLAECLKQNQRVNEAYEILEKARDNAEKLAENDEPTVHKGKIYLLLAECLKQNQRVNEAYEILEKARDNAERLAANDEPTVHKTKVYLLLAERLRLNQRVNEAIDVLEKARDNAEKLAVNEPTFYNLITVYKSLAECLKESQRASEAVEVAEKARDYTERLAVNDEPTVHKIKVYLLLAECLKHSRRVNKAIEVLEKARDNAEKLAVNEPTVYKIKVYKLLAECLKRSGRVNEAIEVFEKACDYTERRAANDEPTVHKTKVYLQLAECLKLNQRVNEAIDVLEKARDNAEKLAENDEPTVPKIKVYLLLAECLKVNQRVNEAIEILGKARYNAEKLAVNDEPSVYKLKVYKLLAECLKQSQRVNEATEILEKACDNAKKLAVNEPTVHKPTVYLLWAEFLKQSERVNEAIEVLEKARENAEKLGVNDEPTVQKIKVYLLLAECLKKDQRVNEAIEVLKKARDNAEKLAVNDEPTVYKTRVYTSLAMAYHTLQNDSEAVRYANKAWEFDQLERTIRTHEYEELQEILQITVNVENN